LEIDVVAYYFFPTLELAISLYFFSSSALSAPQLHFLLKLLAHVPQQLESPPNIKLFLKRIHQPPAYKRGLDREVKYYFASSI
jgi:hypothetical protein